MVPETVGAGAETTGDVEGCEPIVVDGCDDTTPAYVAPLLTAAVGVEKDPSEGALKYPPPASLDKPRTIAEY